MVYGVKSGGTPRALFSVVEGSDDGKSLVVRFQAPLSSKYGTEKTVMARFWPWLSGKSPQVVLSWLGSGEVIQHRGGAGGKGGERSG